MGGHSKIWRLKRHGGGVYFLVFHATWVKEYKRDDVGQVNPPKFDMCEDMANLTYLNEGSVLWNLTARYVEKLIHLSPLL